MSVNYNIMKAMNVLIKEGLVKSFEDVFLFVTKSTVAKEIGMGTQRFEKKRINPILKIISDYEHTHKP